MQPNLVEEKIAIIDSTVASKLALNEQPEAVTIESRFGPISVHTDKAISFPHGLPGIPGSISFCLTELPNIKNNQFKLLQCLENHPLSFIVVPSGYDNQLLDSQHIDDACAVLGINKNNLLLLFIVTVHETTEGRRLSINAKAPVFVDAVNKSAVQYVFQNNTYEIQHFIS